MELIPASAQVLDDLSRTARTDLTADILDLAAQIEAVVPSCVGVSITVARGALTFTLVASSEVAAQLDATQYVSGGPCVEAARGGQEQSVPEILDEGRWQSYARTAAASNVRSSLALPLTTHQELTGSLNIYAADPGAFNGDNARLRELAGAPAWALITNADLEFTSRDRADDAPRDLHYSDLINQAIGVLIGAHRIDPESAKERLQETAARAEVSLVEAARQVLADRPRR